MTDTIHYSKRNLELLLQQYKVQLEHLQSSYEDTEHSISVLLSSGGEMAGPMLTRPLLNILRSEEDIQEFAKYLLYLRRLSDKMILLQGNLSVVQAILDKDNPLQLAGVTFDELEVLDDEHRGSRDKT